MTPMALKDLKLVSFLIVLVGLPVFITYLVKKDVSVSPAISPASLVNLTQEYKRSGLNSFLSSKNQLKNRVRQSLRAKQTLDGTLAAINLAVYLFPDLLDDTNSEKAFSQDYFLPLQRKIEFAPGTKEAQSHFETLRNIVWNHENPKQNEQGLSDYAQQMLKLYGTLSWK